MLNCVAVERNAEQNVRLIGAAAVVRIWSSVGIVATVCLYTCMHSAVACSEQYHLAISCTAMLTCGNVTTDYYMNYCYHTTFLIQVCLSGWTVYQPGDVVHELYFIAAGAVAVQLAGANTNNNNNSDDTTATTATAMDDETAALHSAPAAVVTLARAKSEALGEVSVTLLTVTILI